MDIGRYIHKNPTWVIIAEGLSVTQTRALIGLRQRVKETGVLHSQFYYKTSVMQSA